MDKNARLDHLLDLLGAQRDLAHRLEAHRLKLESHHASRERDRALAQAAKAIRTAQKGVRSLERTIHNEHKQHAIRALPPVVLARPQHR